MAIVCERLPCKRVTIANTLDHGLIVLNATEVFQCHAGLGFHRRGRINMPATDEGATPITAQWPVKDVSASGDS
jgi:hypothetical protein